MDTETSNKNWGSALRLRLEFNLAVFLTMFVSTGAHCQTMYFILREYGVDAEVMRIVIGRESQRATHHAMLAIRFDEGVWLLENDYTIHRNGYQDINRFVYAINEQGIWDDERKD